MTNEELKKKIVEIINDGIIHGEDNFGMPTSKTIENIADALIEAGVVDKSDYASMKETAVKYKAEVSNAENREKAAEHRAEVAERALRDELVQKTIRLGVTDICPWYIQALSEAEKELAEEMKDENI